MKNFKVQVEELVKENEDLHEQLNTSNLITTTEWQVIMRNKWKIANCFAWSMQTHKITDFKTGRGLDQMTYRGPFQPKPLWL